MAADSYLFPKPEDFHPEKRFGDILPNRTHGAYSSPEELLITQSSLMREDFLRAIHEQVNALKTDPSLLDNPWYCYEVTAGHQVREKRCGRNVHQLGIDMSFDAERYKDVKWEAEKRFLNGNLVFLTDNRMEDFVLGVIHNGAPWLLRKGKVVITLCYGVKNDAHFHTLDHSAFAGRKFHLVESRAFYFPYLHVTNVLRKQLAIIKGVENIRAVSGVQLVDLGLKFKEELVAATSPSRQPETLEYASAAVLQKVKEYLNASQSAALEKVLQRRVALVQGPPGTGKTHLAVKIAQYFVEIKKANPDAFRGPVLVVAMTNHAVDEFLLRCREFSDKIIHGYSQHHEQKELGPLQEKYHKAGFSDQLEFMRQAEILAMTTSRAAYTKSRLDKLGIKIVIVEEAAEALEAHILACITEDTQHLIQIGDHKQLRAVTSHQELTRTFHMDVSLFERLVNNGADCPMLNEQRRMRPAIADLVRYIYPTLTDDVSTRTRPAIKGIDLRTPVFWMDHQEPEKSEGTGYINEFEAPFAAHLANYLLASGYDTKQVTILTTYRRQLIRVIKEAKAIGGDVKEVRMTTVDNFQGEECEIIILSLTRSNLEGSIGFMALENRACVALSRARDGFFLLGDLSCLTRSGSAVWKHVKDSLTELEKIGDVLPLKCAHDRKFAARTAEDVRVATKGCAVCEVYRSWVAAQKAVERTIMKMDKAKKKLAKLQNNLLLRANMMEEEELEMKNKSLEEALAWQSDLDRKLPLRIQEEEATRERWRLVEPLWKQGKIDVHKDSLETVLKLVTPKDLDRVQKLFEMWRLNGGESTSASAVKCAE